MGVQMEFRNPPLTRGTGQAPASCQWVPFVSQPNQRFSCHRDSDLSLNACQRPFLLGSLVGWVATSLSTEEDLPTWSLDIDSSCKTIHMEPEHSFGQLQQNSVGSQTLVCGG